MSKKKLNSRWKKGNERYPKDVLDYIYGQYREQDGWHKAARIDKGKNNVR